MMPGGRPRQWVVHSLSYDDLAEDCIRVTGVRSSWALGNGGSKIRVRKEKADETHADSDDELDKVVYPMGSKKKKKKKSGDAGGKPPPKPPAPPPPP